MGIGQSAIISLLLPSVFSDVLLFWVPGIFTISNGSTAEHYRYHFKGVLESISEVAEAKEISIYDEMFAGVRNKMISGVRSLISPASSRLWISVSHNE